MLWLCRVSLVYASDIPLDVLTAWGQALRHATISRVDGRFVPVHAHEGERQPLFYRFLPARPRRHSPVVDYVAEPTAQLRWGRQTYNLAEIPPAWGFTHDHLPWSWPTLVPYRLRVGGHTYTCLEAHFAGLGMSGSAQRYKAVLVVEATRAVEHLYFSGYGAGCALVGDYTGARRLGYMHFTPGTADMYAHVMTVTGTRKVRAQRAYAVRAVSVGQGPTRVQARPIPLALVTTTPEP